jgi:hypothetical protein
MRLVALLVLLALPAPAAGAVRIGEDGEAYALAVAHGSALAVVESGDRTLPFDLVRSTGAGVSVVGGFGELDSEFPSVAAGDDGRAFAGWGLPVSGGYALRVAPVSALDEPLDGVPGTGPGRLAVGAADVLLAYPDRDGNAALSTLSTDRRAAAEAPLALTSTAPFRRHLPLGVAAVEGGALVLDLIQERSRTELRVIGPGAPAAPILSLPALRHVPARMDVRDGRIAVGYLVSGRARVAVARLGGAWARRSLRGEGGGDGAPAPMIAGGSVSVAYTQRVRAKGARTQREVFLFAPDGTRRLTTTPGDERDALAAAGPEGDAYVAWTRREPRRGATAAFLERVD